MNPNRLPYDNSQLVLGVFVGALVLAGLALLVSAMHAASMWLLAVTS